MSKEKIYCLIKAMNIRLYRIIEKNNFNLISNEVLNYSRRLDKVLNFYNHIKNK